MIDYAPLLQRACERLSPNTPEARAVLFAQARHALESQLHGVRPHLTSEAIAQELDRLDGIIQTIEKSYAHGRIPMPNIPPPLQPVLPQTSGPGLGPVRHAYMHLPYWKQNRFLVGIGISALLLGTLLWYFFRPLHRGTLFHHETSSSHSIGKVQDRLYKKPESLDKAHLLASSPSESGLKPGDQGALSRPKELPIAQKAFLFEEDPSTQDASMAPEPSVGHVIWRLGTSDTEQGQTVSPTVETTITIPQKNLVVQMILSKNTDLALPASHTLKITFSSTASSSSSSSAHPFGQRISAIGSPHFKEQQEGRGAPLIGQTVPVLPNVFLMGLSNEGEDQVYNLNLLKSPGWIDIPILFNDKRHAIITFEKGIFGQHVIDQALEAWQ